MKLAQNRVQWSALLLEPSGFATVVFVVVNLYHVDVGFSS
jgi:hypothetical protein